MRKLPDIQQFLFNLKKLFRLFFVILFFVCFFVNFGVVINYGGLRNDHSETPVYLSKEDNIISMVQQFSCIAGAH